jgi:hypothetical protein
VPFFRLWIIFLPPSKSAFFEQLPVHSLKGRRLLAGQDFPLLFRFTQKAVKGLAAISQGWPPLFPLAFHRDTDGADGIIFFDFLIPKPGIPKKDLI